MNLRLLSKLLGIIAFLIGATMFFSLPWAYPGLGMRLHPDAVLSKGFETRGFLALLCSIGVCFAVGGWLWWMGRRAEGRLLHKEAMAIVGLSWMLATVLGALPFSLAGVYQGPSLRLLEPGEPPSIQHSDRLWGFRQTQWSEVPPVTPTQYRLLLALAEQNARGLSEDGLIAATNDPRAVAELHSLATRQPWSDVIFSPNDPRRPLAPPDRKGHYRIRWVRMSIFDSLFESQSGFSTTGATVISDLEDPHLVPHCLLFWRSSTHFLGGLGIIVLFVAVLGQGSAGKALMRAEMPGPSKEGSTARMQHTAWIFTAIYCALNLVLTLLLWAEGLSIFDALCHAFGTMATGGFSTWNKSLGHFDSRLIEYTVVVFMLLAGTNFTLLYYILVRRQPGVLWKDTEWRVYMALILGITVIILMFGIAHNDFPGASLFQKIESGVRYGLFQVVAIITTTGYGTHDFDSWSSVGRGILFLLMFVGGCAGSTGGGLKVIRHILFLSIMRLEVERSFRPLVVRPLRLAGTPVDDPDLRRNIMVYFCLILVIFVFSWLFVVTFEPDSTWGARSIEHKLVDSASSVAATLNNIGPGLGTVGATQNYGHFSPLSKLLFTWLMMVGRVEIFVILVLFMPSFWRSH